MIKKDDVEKVAKLARLEVNEVKLQKDLESILSYFGMIGEVDASNVLPTFHATEEFFKENVVRKDEDNSFNPEKIIEAFPNKKGRHVKVKAIL